MGLNDDQVEPLTPEQEAQAEAEFEAAFKTTREQSGAEGSTLETGANGEPLITTPGDQGNPSPEDPAAQAQAQAEAKAQAAAQAAADAQAEADAPVTLTKKQLDDLQAQLALIPHLQEEVRRTRDTHAGKLGSIQQQMQALADKAAAGQKPAIKDLKRLKAEFPELATMLEEDLSEVFGSTAAPAPAANAESTQPLDDGTPAAQHQVDPLTDMRVQEVLRSKDMAIVDAVHPDWRDLRATPEFNEWRTKLPPAAQDLLANTWDSQVLVDAIKDFKTYRAQRATQAQAQADANKQRGNRLANAIPATTGAPTGRATVDEDAEFEAGFNKVRTGRGS